MSSGLSHSAYRSFNLLRWYSVLSLICIALISAGLAFMLSRFLMEQMIQRDAALSSEFIESIVQAEHTWSYFVDRDSEEAKVALDSFFNHVAHMPDVVLANVYNREQIVLWSSDKKLVGKILGPNDELKSALSGRVIVESGVIGSTEKQEHASLASQREGTRFVEAYIPVWDRGHQSVIGVVELYKIPVALLQAIDLGNRLVWVGTFLGALFLYVTLFWIVRRASMIIKDQQEMLVESEMMVTVGEMASTVAHGIRNPLASIRSSAELILENDLADIRDSAADIIAASDSLDRSIRDLLLFSRTEGAALERVDLCRVVQQCLQGLASRIEQDGINLSVDLPSELPAVKGNAALLGEVISCLVTNAIDAMPNGGNLTIKGRDESSQRVIEIRISDTGHGLSNDLLTRVHRPFFTTKPRGLGLGLTLSRRIVTRYGGTLHLSSVEGEGTVVNVRLLTWS